MTDILENLSVEWSHIDGQGLIRVIPTDQYRTGFIVIASIGPIAEKHDYYPDMMLSRAQVTITIDDADEKKAHALAKEIDKLLTLDEASDDTKKTDKS